MNELELMRTVPAELLPIIETASTNISILWTSIPEVLNLI